MALSKEVMDELDKQADEDNAKEKADLEAMRKWHESPEYKKLKEDALKKAGDGKGA